MPTDDLRFAEVRRRGGEAYAAYLAAGYREWYSSRGPQSTPYLLQRAIRDDSGRRRYFINIWAYDWSDYPQRVGDPVSFHAEVQFNTHGDGDTFDVDLHRATGPEKAEAFFARVYEAMNCTPYDGEDDTDAR